MLILLFLCGFAVLSWVLFPYEELVKAAVLIPVWVPLISFSFFFFWRNLSSLHISKKPYECLPLCEDQRVPEMRRWKVSFNLMNPTPWETTINSCNIVDKGVFKDGFVLGDVSFDKYISKWGSGKLFVQFDYGLKEDPCSAKVGLIFKLEYMIGGGIIRKDEYWRFFTLLT